MLFAERAAALFVAGLLVLVVVERAWRRGELPDELSGRGVRYATVEDTAQLRDAVAEAVEPLQTALTALTERVDALEEDAGLIDEVQDDG